VTSQYISNLQPSTQDSGAINKHSTVSRSLQQLASCHLASQV